MFGRIRVQRRETNDETRIDLMEPKMRKDKSRYERESHREAILALERRRL